MAEIWKLNITLFHLDKSFFLLHLHINSPVESKHEIIFFTERKQSLGLLPTIQLDKYSRDTNNEIQRPELRQLNHSFSTIKQCQYILNVIQQSPV